VKDNDAKVSTQPDKDRRSFLKKSALTIGVASHLAAPVLTSAHAAASEDALPLAMSGYRYNRTALILDGPVSIDGCAIDFEVSGIGDINSNVFNGPQSLDVTEIGLHPFMLAYANDGFRDYTLLPIFPLRLFRHRSVFVRTDRGIDSPGDLKGKTVATTGYSSTSLTWIRGVLQDEYGIRPEALRWVISSKDSSAKDSGAVSRNESVLPDGVSVQQGPEGKDESDLLALGEVDAVFHAAEPRAYIEGHEKIGRLFDDYRTTERDYYARIGIFPIMHAVAIRKTLARQHPWLVEAVFDAYSQSKQQSYRYMEREAWFRDSLPWYVPELASTRALMGENFYSYGIEPNRKALETLFRYSYEQGLCKRELTVEELFEPASLGLAESSVV
jgi:4,5-dihydroxyphthalate decarboxylase